MSSSLVIPDHIAVIIDGNRRWAQFHNSLPWFGHRQGAKTLDNFLNWCVELNVPQVSVYTLSTENLDRPKKELDEIFKLYYKYLEKWASGKSDFLTRYEVKVKFVGDFGRLPPKLVKLMGKIMEKTARYQKKALNLLVAYGSHFELTETIRKLAEKAIDSGKIEISQKDVEANLLVPTPVDLVIRTGGWSRLSNFLLWQTAYAEIYVTKTLWPDFTKEELIKAIKWFNSEKRNFGK